MDMAAMEAICSRSTMTTSVMTGMLMTTIIIITAGMTISAAVGTAVGTTTGTACNTGSLQGAAFLLPSHERRHSHAQPDGEGRDPLGLRR